MELVAIIAGIWLVFAAVMVISSISVVYQDFKWYSVVYDSLPYRKFYICHEIVKTSRHGEKDDGFVWFPEKGDFKLVHDVYLHNTGYTKWSIYGWYWLNKYQKWMKENVNVEALEEWYQVKY